MSAPTLVLLIQAFLLLLVLSFLMGLGYLAFLLARWLRSR